jgi:hypothetical protein
MRARFASEEAIVRNRRIRIDRSGRRQPVPALPALVLILLIFVIVPVGPSIFVFATVSHACRLASIRIHAGMMAMRVVMQERTPARGERESCNSGRQ